MIYHFKQFCWSPFSCRKVSIKHPKSAVMSLILPVFTNWRISVSDKSLWVPFKKMWYFTFRYLDSLLVLLHLDCYWHKWTRKLNWADLPFLSFSTLTSHKVTGMIVNPLTGCSVVTLATWYSYCSIVLVALTYCNQL